MTLPPEVLAEKHATLERHLRRIAEVLPDAAELLRPETSTSDTVILHLWQGLQTTLDLAMTACVRLHLGAPDRYRDAFGKLAAAGVIPEDLSARLQKAAGFRNRVVHDYDVLDMQQVWQIARDGPADLRGFIACLRDRALGG